MLLHNLNIGGSRTLVGVTDLEFNFVAHSWSGRSFHVTDMNEDIVGLPLDIDEAEATMIEPACNCSFQYFFTSSLCSVENCLHIVQSEKNKPR